MSQIQNMYNSANNTYIDGFTSFSSRLPYMCSYVIASVFVNSTTAFLVLQNVGLATGIKILGDLEPELLKKITYRWRPSWNISAIVAIGQVR
jgi:hypothetical protein